MEIKISAVGKLQKTKKGDEYTGIKNETGDWINVMGNHTNVGLQKGMIFKITDPKTLGSGTTLWAFPDKKKEELEKDAPKKEDPCVSAGTPSSVCKEGPWKDPNKQPFCNYENFVRKVATLAKEILDGHDDQAVAAIVDTAVIAFLNGKIDFPCCEDDPPINFINPTEDIPF